MTQPIIKYVAALTVGVALMTACTPAAPEPTAAPTVQATPGPGAVPGTGTTLPPNGGTGVKVEIIDASGSARATDLVAAATNKALGLVASMEQGSTVVIRALTSNVNSECTDIVIELPLADPTTGDALNPARLGQLRQANRARVAADIDTHLACVAEHYRGGTEFFGGLHNILRRFPAATEVHVYSDACDNLSPEVGNICRPDLLADPARLAEVEQRLFTQIQGIVPSLSPSTILTFHGVGRGTQLVETDRIRLEGLIDRWAAQTGAQYYFEPS